MRSKRMWTTMATMVTVAALCGVAAAGNRRKAYSNGVEDADATSWWFAGNAGVDRGVGLSHTGANNVWARGTSGWNAVNIEMPTLPGASCTATIWVRRSATLSNGVVSVHGFGAGLPLVTQQNLDQGPSMPPDRYDQYSLSFTATALSQLLLVGFWGNGQDAWVQVDDMRIECNQECSARTCADFEAECGTRDDGCGNMLQCGHCDNGESCHANMCF